MKRKWSAEERYNRAARALERAKGEPLNLTKSTELPWIADKAGGLTIGNIKFNRGTQIPADVLKSCTNFRVLQDQKFIRQVPKAGPVKPIKITAPAKERPTPELRFTAGNGDALASYRGLKRNFLIDLVNESYADGFDALLESGDQTAEAVQQHFENRIASSNRASQIYRVALRLAAENFAVQNRTTGRRIVQRI